MKKVDLQSKPDSFVRNENQLTIAKFMFLYWSYGLQQQRHHPNRSIGFDRDRLECVHLLFCFPLLISHRVFISFLKIS
ncbi:hypothetical protein BLOT_012359 [Blomia tropicalis]|nr:hypothetical protein BLOT_012359 [Blomia tropicalis]